MFMKQYNYKPRSNSTSSTGSGQGVAAGSPPKDENKTANVANTGNAGSVSGAVAAGRRRSSGSEKFAGLNAYKRGSQDEASTAKKASFADQKVGGGGILGGMWHNFTKGS